MKESVGSIIDISNPFNGAEKLVKNAHSLKTSESYNQKNKINWQHQQTDSSKEIVQNCNFHDIKLAYTPTTLKDRTLSPEKELDPFERLMD